jgi:hypothetical protein
MEDGNLVLRLLREIRSEQAAMKAKQEEDGLRLMRVERRVDELHESVGMALGFSAHATQVTESFGQRFDKLQDEILSLKRRVAELEAGHH